VTETPADAATPEAAEHRIKLTLHYDGGGFAGWQFQPERRTVQGEVTTALSLVTDRPSTVVAAGRTDSGVHAVGQVASTLVPARWTAGALARALNAVLPDDIWVSAAEGVPLAFHARYDAVARGYLYRVGVHPVSRSPFLRRWCWPVRENLDPEALADAAGRFTGEHSFRAFAKTGQPERGERCTVHRSEWRAWGRAGIAYHVIANRFLHHMVRYMVGTMIDVARARRPAGEIGGLLDERSGLATSPPAPARGLFLTRVYYATNAWEGEEPFDEVLP